MNILKMAPASSMSRAFKGAVKSFAKWRNSALKSAPGLLTKINLQRTLFFYPKISMKKKNIMVPGQLQRADMIP